MREGARPTVIVLFDRAASAEQVQQVRRFLEGQGIAPRLVESSDAAILEVSDGDAILAKRVSAFGGVAHVQAASTPYPLLTSFAAGEREFEVAGVPFGGDRITLIAGPCSVESESQVMSCAEAVAKHGGGMLRGGAFKPSTSPYGFQGLGKPGLEMLSAAAKRYGLGVVTEAMDPRHVELVAQYAQMIQVGARNMQNFDLLREVGKVGLPILLKRHWSARLDEWLLAAEHLAVAGARKIVLCERGIRTFENSARNTLDLTTAILARERSGLPVIVDPSHACGKRELVPALAFAAIAAGLDGLVVEIHPDPANALKDGRQSMSFEAFEAMAGQLSKMATIVGRSGLARVVSGALS